MTRTTILFLCAVILHIGSPLLLAQEASAPLPLEYKGKLVNSKRAQQLLDDAESHLSRELDREHPEAGVVGSLQARVALLSGLNQSRQNLGTGRELAILESEVCGALGEARALLAIRGLPASASDAMLLHRETDGRRTWVEAMRIGDRDLILLHARCEVGERYLELDQIVADPHVGFSNPVAL